ncbi:glycosyltransferase family 39 protein [Haladaptatus sp. DYSN1]|uniref:ArnT family glycosyltransferase n=2 Tax=Haladaptatus TaxID=367188 RepID=UPI0024067310|nr:glycosyltransferase family 39 protein [Haladaptatus sp. DYSN1]
MATDKRTFEIARPDSLDANGYVWLLPAVLAGSLVHLIYLGTHPYPAFGAGLFLLMAEQVSHHGYALPSAIPHYASSIPFAYPPLMFYVVAALRDLTGADPLFISRVLPGLVTTTALVPCYLFVRELLDSGRKAGLATFVVAVSPPILQWHISAGGIVRAPAFLFLVSGLYTGLMLFKTRRPKWLVASLGLFSLTILTHPTYTIFFVLSYLCLFAGFSRTISGLRDGAIVGVGGLVLTVPWWGQVLATHGTAVFSGAAGTHGGLAQKVPAVLSDVVSTLVPGGPAISRGTHSAELVSIQPWFGDLSVVGFLQLVGGVVLFVGAAASLVIADEDTQSKLAAFVSAQVAATRGEFANLPVFGDGSHPRVTAFLLGWLFLTVTIVSQHRFAYLIHSILVAILVYEYLLPTLDDIAPRPTRQQVEFGVLLVLAVSCLSVGGLYAASQLDSHGGSASLPAFIDDSDAAAMSWAAENTDPSARFLVMGDAAEWFPQSTDRAITTGPWGIEWKGSGAYSTQLAQFIDVSTCADAACVSQQVERAGVHPDYVYVPTDGYTVRGMETDPAPGLYASLVAAEDYTLVFENDGVAIFRVTDAASADSLAATQSPPLLGPSGGAAIDHHGTERETATVRAPYDRN